MNNLFHKLTLVFFTLPLLPSFANVYITVKGGKVTKARLAITKLHPLGDYKEKQNSFPKKLERQIQTDLRFTNLFELVDYTRYKQLDLPKLTRSIEYGKWAPLKVSFVLKLGYRIEKENLALEAVLFDILGKKKIFGTRYEYPAKQFPRLAHALAEDILQELTGEKGLFRSRVLMVCRKKPSKQKKTQRGKRTKNVPKNIFVSDPDGRNFKRVTSEKTLSLSPSWSPDGHTIAYTQYETRRHKGVLKTIPVLRKHDLKTGKRTVLSDRNGMNSGADWSPTGKKVATTMSFTGRPEIYVIEADGSGKPNPLSRAAKVRNVSGTGFQKRFKSLLFDVEPSWSPDGKQIVFSSARTGHPMIYVVDVAKKIASQLTFAGTYNSSPDWSPKGDKILFAAQRKKTGNFDVFVIDPDGNNLERVTFGGRLKGGRRVNSENPTWAPTGRHFAYASNRTGHYAIYVTTLEGNYVQRISPPNKECTSPAWGPFDA